MAAILELAPVGAVADRVASEKALLEDHLLLNLLLFRLTANPLAMAVGVAVAVGVVVGGGSVTREEAAETDDGAAAVAACAPLEVVEKTRCPLNHLA